MAPCSAMRVSRFVAVPLDAHDLDGAFGGDPLDGDPGLHVLEPGHTGILPGTKTGGCNGLIATMYRRSQPYLRLVVLPRSSWPLGWVAKVEILILMLAATHVPDYGILGFYGAPTFVRPIGFCPGTVAEGVDGKQRGVPRGYPQPTARPS